MKLEGAPSPDPTRIQGAPGWARRRDVIRLGAASIVCGLGLAACLVTLVRAADDTGLLDVIRYDYLNRVAAAVRLTPRRPAPPRLAVKPKRKPVVRVAEGSRKRVERKARVGLAALNARLGSAARLGVGQTMCVRTCDGYAFPVGQLSGRSDLAAHHAACSTACPAAETKLYTMASGLRMDDIGGAKSVGDGSLYRRLKTAFLFQKQLVPSCSCQGPDNVATHIPILLDQTLRTGDVVIDKTGGARVYAGNGRIPHSPRAFADYRTSPVIARAARAQVDRAVGTSQRETTARAYEKTLRVQKAALADPPARPQRASLPETVLRVERVSAPMVALREVRAPAGSASGVRVYQVRHDAGTIDPSGARIIVLR